MHGRERHFHDVWDDPFSADVNCRWLHELQTCKEDFPEGGRLVYSSVTMLIQYLLPTITISVAYIQILGQLRTRLKQKKSQVINLDDSNVKSIQSPKIWLVRGLVKFVPAR